jgi:hypothetical protein
VIEPDSLIVPRTVADLSDAVLQRYVGDFRINENEVRRVIKAGTILYTQRGQGPPLPIRPISETEFFYEGAPTRVRFEVDSEGKVKGMTVFQGTSEKGEIAWKIKS